MIAFEVVFIIVGAIVLIVSIKALGKPLAEAYAEKLKTKYRAIGSQEADNLKKRLHQLEGEILDMRNQLKTLQETSEYTVKLLEPSEKKSPQQLQDKS